MSESHPQRFAIGAIDCEGRERSSLTYSRRTSVISSVMRLPVAFLNSISASRSEVPNDFTTSDAFSRDAPC